ncbi:MAG: hypothetical protein ACFFDB_00785 [Promethearchaeota archaeon]
MVDYEDVQFCPECGSSDVKFEVASEAEPKVTSEVKAEIEPKEKSEVELKSPPTRVYTWTQHEPSQKRSGYSSGTGSLMSESAKIRLVLGLIGFIMLLSALGIFLSGMSGIFGGGSGGLGGLAGVITLGVIGFIFLAIATKGEICNC